MTAQETPNPDVSSASPALAPAGAASSFFPVPLESLAHDARDMDLYLKHVQDREPALYRAAGVPFTASDARRLASQRIAFVYVPMHQHAVYRRLLRERLDASFRDPGTSRAARTRIVRASCSKMIEEVLLFPGRPEAVAMVADISESFAQWSSGDAAGFSYLLDMSAHDYYTITHMVNVGVGCGMLYAKLRPDDARGLPLIIQGGLLHDVGKRGVPQEVLNKEGKLEPDEWLLIRAHPMKGFDELRTNPDVPPIVLEMTRDHHEKLDGSGYPAGLKAGQIGFGARLCAVIDVYDAITAARPYRGPIPPGEALSLMARSAGAHFDAEIFAAWSSIVENLIQQDPARAVPPVRQNLDESRPESADDDERRHHKRARCNLNATGKLLRKGKPTGPALNTHFPLCVLDASRGGLQVQTDFPLTMNDLLEVNLPLKGGQKMERLIRIVRVRRDARGNWIAGGCFMAGSAATSPHAGGQSPKAAA